MLQLYDPGDSHLHAAEHRNHLQDLVVERRGCEGLQGPVSELTSAPGLNTPPHTTASLRRPLHQKPDGPTTGSHCGGVSTPDLEGSSPDGAAGLPAPHTRGASGT